MLLESEALLEDGNRKFSLSPGRPAVSNQFIESSRRRRFRFFSVLLLLCVFGYLSTSTMFLAGNENIEPLIISRQKPTGVIEQVKLKLVSKLVPGKVINDSIEHFQLNLQTSSPPSNDYGTSQNLSQIKEEINFIDTNNLNDPIPGQEKVLDTKTNQTTETVETENSSEVENSSSSSTSTAKPASIADQFISSSTTSSIDNTVKLGEGCKIPRLDPFSPSIKKALYETVSKPLCGTKFPLMFETDFDSNLIQLKEPKSLHWNNCCYRVITRIPDANDPDNTEKAGSDCYNITGNRTKIPPDHEFIGIYCTPNPQKNETVTPKQKMVDAFPFTPLKLEVENRIKKIRSTKKLNSKHQVNLVILGLDAVSNMNFQRIMPKVHRYLIDDLHAISMNGYTKIGDNTFPNLLAALTSWNHTEIRKRCEKPINGFFDTCPFLWKNFSQEGYITSFGEDCAWMGAFNYLKRGFKKPPTDFYLRPLARAMGNLIAYDYRGNDNICNGPRMTIDILLNYMKKLATTMGHDKRYFQLIWSTALTHDFVNQGKLGESSVLSTLKWFQSKGFFKNTVFILMSDHGIRWGPIRELQQGKVEENLPLLYFLFPEWFKNKYKSAVANMKANRERLTSPYDTYETLKDILYLDTISENNLKTRQKKLDRFTETNIPRGISMFLPIPRFRTCQLAGIAEHYCVCHTSQSIPTENMEVKQAANYAVYTLNSYVAKYTTCAYLALSSVVRAQINIPQSKNISNGEKIFEFSFTTDPGKGLFEATVVRSSKGKWAMSGAISRTNLYGNQSHCISDKEMKKFCYCINLR